MSDLEAAREAFLSMLADAGDDFQEQPDGDVNDAGRMMDCTTYKIITGHRQFEELCEALGIKRSRYNQSLMEAIDEAIAVPAAGSVACKPLTLDESPEAQARARAAKSLYDETMKTP